MSDWCSTETRCQGNRHDFISVGPPLLYNYIVAIGYDASGDDVAVWDTESFLEII